MAKKVANDNELMTSAKELGGKTMREVDPVKIWIDTGVLGLNYICSGKFIRGGIPGGRITEIYGPSSSCKSLFALNIIRGTQNANGISVLLDVEGTVDMEFAKKVSNVDPDRVLMLDAETLEEGFAKIISAIKVLRNKFNNERPIVEIYDSLSVSAPESEFGTTDMSYEKMLAAKTKVAEGARICSRELRKLNPLTKKNNAAVVFVNQVRTNIGMMFGDPDTSGAGGKALPFYASLRLKTFASKKFKDERGNIIGMCVSVKNVKNKVFTPFGEIKDMQLFFNKGINPLGGLLDLFYKIGRIDKVKDGVFTVVETYTSDGNKYEFKGSMKRNDVPLKVLLDNPKLVDANTAEEVQEYVSAFQSGLDASYNDIATAEDLTAADLDEN